MVKNLPATVGDSDLIPGSGRSPGVGNGSPAQYFCLENSMNSGAWHSPWGQKELDVTEHTDPRSIEDEPTISCPSRKQGSYQRPSKGF